jgi:hypothetical protein
MALGRAVGRSTLCVGLSVLQPVKPTLYPASPDTSRPTDLSVASA